MRGPLIRDASRQVGLGHDDVGEALLIGEGDHRQHAVGVAQAAVEGQLAEEDGVRQVGGHLLGAEQDADGDGQVVGGSGFLEVGRGQVDDDALHRKDAAGVADGRPHALAGFLYGGVRQADDDEGRQPGGDVRFDFNDRAIEPNDGAGHHLGEHNCLTI